LTQGGEKKLASFAKTCYSIFTVNVISEDRVAELLDGKWSLSIKVIEDAFLDHSAEMVPKVYLGRTGYDFRAMPAALDGTAAVKWIGVFPNNPKAGLPTTTGVLILSDRENGETLAVMECRTLTAYRTAATSAIAAKYCAPKEVNELAFIGCGLQAYYHFLAYQKVFPNIKRVSLFDKNEEAVDKLSNKLPNNINKFKYVENVQEAVRKADIITTLTPSTEGYLDILHVANNCHINAVGADAIGKRELMTNVIDGAANIICDDPVQAFHSGELQYNEWPYLDVVSLRHVIKNHKTMQLDAGVSVFDSTGVAIEDIAVARLVYNLNYQYQLLDD
jgi:alanine dehydrogenase